MTPRIRRHSPYLWAALVVLLVAGIVTQVTLEGKLARPGNDTPGVVWIQSTDLMRRLTAGFNTIWADIYWIRAVQYYGDTRLSTDAKKSYNRLYPLLDITTTLDPRFSIAYRFGAILLSEAYPNGPGSPDQALALLGKAMREMPEKWQYYHDAGFVEYWWRRDPKAAAQWFLKAESLPGTPDWLKQAAVSMLAEGGDRGAARSLWIEMAEHAEQEWLRQAARRGLMQLDAEAQIEILEAINQKFHDVHHRYPSTWRELTQAGMLRQIPVDPSGSEYLLDPESGSVDVDRTSKLFPLRRRLR